MSFPTPPHSPARVSPFALRSTPSAVFAVTLSHNLFVHLSPPLVSVALWGSQIMEYTELLCVEWTNVSISCEICNPVLLYPVTYSQDGVHGRPDFCQISWNSKTESRGFCEKYTDSPNSTNPKGKIWTWPNCAHFDLSIRIKLFTEYVFSAYCVPRAILE